MIQEDYVSFETAKLLKEKGFKGDCIMSYIDNELINVYDDDYPSMYELENTGDDVVDAPTLQMAMKWLREVHKLHIEFVLNQDVQDENAVIENYYHFNVSRLDRFANEGGDCKFYKFYEEACEAAIKHCLENLI